MPPPRALTPWLAGVAGGPPRFRPEGTACLPSILKKIIIIRILPHGQQAKWGGVTEMPLFFPLCGKNVGAGASEFIQSPASLL